MHRQGKSRINDQSSTVDVARRRTAQEHNVIRDLLRVGGSPQRRGGLDDASQRRGALHAGLHHRRVDPRRAHRVDTDAILHVIDRCSTRVNKPRGGGKQQITEASSVEKRLTCCLRDADDRVLGCRVRHHARSCAVRTHRAEVDDGASAQVTAPPSSLVRERLLARHGLGYSANAEHGSEDISFDGFGEAVDLDIGSHCPGHIPHLVRARSHVFLVMGPDDEARQKAKRIL